MRLPGYHSLAAVRIANPHDRDQWCALLDELLTRAGGGDLSVYLQVTRGVAKRDHAFPANVAPTVFAMTNPLVPVPREVLDRGVQALTRPDPRWQRCDIKAITLLANVLLRQEAVEGGAAEALLIRDGLAVEGAASNLFVVQAGVLLTPPLGPGLLPGITRELVLELARAAGIPAHEQPVPEALLRECDELLLTSSTKEILPVTTLDGAPVDTGRPGPVFHRLHGLYQDYKAAQTA